MFTSRVVEQSQATDKMVDLVVMAKFGSLDSKKPYRLCLYGKQARGKNRLFDTLCDAMQHCGVWAADVPESEVVLRIDCTLYPHSKDIKNLKALISEFLAKARKDRRNCVAILVDEWGKGSKKIFSSLSTLYDQGTLSSEKAKSDLRVIIIGATNIGSEYTGLEHRPKESSSPYDHQVHESVLQLIKKDVCDKNQAHLSRFGDIIGMYDYDEDHVDKLVEIRMDEIAQQLLKQLGLTVRFHESITSQVGKEMKIKDNIRQLLEKVDDETRVLLPKFIAANCLDVTVSLEARCLIARGNSADGCEIVENRPSFFGSCAFATGTEHSSLSEVKDKTQNIEFSSVKRFGSPH